MSYFLKTEEEITEYLDSVDAFKNRKWTSFASGSKRKVRSDAFITMRQGDLTKLKSGKLGFLVKLNHIQTFNLFLAEQNECDFEYDFSFLPVTSTTFTFSTIRETFPKFPRPIQCQKGRPIIHSKFKSFTGIENVFDCEKLTISNANDGVNITGFLSFLKMPRLKHVEMTPLTVEQAEAFKIINDYLNGDRNISKCQTQLLKNGLKQFATL